MAEVRDGKRHLYFWGWVAYRDIFEDSNPHLTEFCNELTISEGDITTGEKVRFLQVSCGTHNCADEECRDYAEVKKRLEGE